MSTIPVVRDIIAANDADGQLVLVRLHPAHADVPAFVSPGLALGMFAEDVIPTLLGEVKELEVDLADATADAFKDATRVGLYRSYSKRVRAALLSGVHANKLRRELSDACDSLAAGLRELDR